MRRGRFMACALLLACSCNLGCSGTQIASTAAKNWPASSGQLDRGDFEAHLGSPDPAEIAQLLGPQLARAPDLAVVLALVKNRGRASPVRVDPATVRLRLRSGETLVPLTRDEVTRWAAATGSTVRSYAIFDPIEVNKNEARAAAAVFRLPTGGDASSVEAQMTIDLGSDGQVSVTSRLF